jgi:hypothetical protein
MGSTALGKVMNTGRMRQARRGTAQFSYDEAQQAKAKVLEHWNYLDALSKRRFPKSENLAHEGLLYVLENLEANEWKRVRAWQGLGHFLPFITTLASRLLTNFTRERYGSLRKPAWLAEKRDLLWDTAYLLLVVEKWSRHEAIERLLLSEPPRERWFIEEVVRSIRERCQRRPPPIEQLTSIEAAVEEADTGSAPEEQLRIQDKEMLEAFWAYLQGDSVPITPRISELLARLKGCLHFTEEDRLLLKLRYQDGLTMTAIAKLLSLQGDPYKRLHKTLAQAREACQKAGLLLEDA